MKVLNPVTPVQSHLHGNAGVSADHTAKTLLVDSGGERNLTLLRDPQGRVEVVLSPPPVTHLVLSGGGAKGVAFSGGVQALEDAGTLEGIRVISGSSAGAISAALVASGMGAAAFDGLSDNINLPSLLNSKDPVTAWLQEASSTLGKHVGRLPGLAGNISQLLMTLLPRLKTAAVPLEDMIRDESRKALLGRIADTPRETRPAEVMCIADKLSAGGAPTFADLEVLSRNIPAVKQLNITGTGMFGGRPQLVVFNSSLTPDMDIARAARGLLLNTPASGVVDRLLSESPLSKSESLIIKFESDPVGAPAQRGGFFSSLVDCITGTPHSAAEAYQDKRLEAFADQTLALPLNTEKGDFRGLLNGTVNFTMKDEYKQHLQERAREAVEGHLQRRATTRESHSFGTLDEAVLAMDDKTLASVQPALQKDTAATSVLMFREEAKQVLHALDHAIAAVEKSHDGLLFTPKLSSAVRNLDALARSPEKIEWLGRRLNDPDQHNFQALLQVAAKRGAGDASPSSRVMTCAVAEMKRRDIAVSAESFTREVIYPSLFRPGQPASNVELLQRAARDLAEATSPLAFNRVLDDLSEKYQARNKPWSTPSSSTTVEMAKAWRMPV
jgi:exoenzyme U